MIFGYFTLFVALVISAVAAYYSIVGLTAIFAAAVTPIIIMGAALEVGKLTAAVWLKVNWARARFTYKLYLVPAVGLLMFLTSMGIFGFLSKAHSDQSLVSGDVQSKIAIYDEKIKTARENIEANRRQLKQMDEAVDQVMARSTDEKGADKSNAIRRSQQRDRVALAKEIEANQKLIASLNDEAAPIRAEIRKVEAEVGPIKYIAALIYGDNPDSNLLESAVRWVIIIIVAVFDPLALVLILAAQQSIRWSKEEPSEYLQDEQGVSTEPDIDLTQTFPPVPPAEKEGILAQPIKDLIPEAVSVVEEHKPEPSLLEKHPYLNQKFAHFKNLEPMVYKPEDKVEEEIVPTPMPEPTVDVVDRPGDYLEADYKNPRPLTPAYINLGNDYYEVDGKMVHSRVLKDLYPEVQADIDRKSLGLHADNLPALPLKSRASFGTQFPDEPLKGDMFLHVGTVPSKLFKYNGGQWIQVDKTIADSYTYDEEYLKYLVGNISKGIISTDELTPSEQDQIEEYLKKNG